MGNYDESLANLKGQGFAVATEAVLNGSRFCYVDTRPLIGCMTELVDDSETGRWLTETVRSASAGWDGKTNPIRHLSVG